MEVRIFNGVKIKVEFNETANRQQISSGDNLNTLFGKIRKWLSDLKPVAFSGNYVDLTGKPTKLSEFENDKGYVTTDTKPNNGTLTIQKNGTNVQSFSANQAGNATANITVPTKTSELTNDSGYKTTDTTYGVVSKTANGLAPKLPNETTTTKYLRQDGTWTVPPNTTYGNMSGASASSAGKAGLVPAPAAGTQGKYLRGDGTWQTPPDTNTTYGVATQSAAGLMSAADKKKLDGFKGIANNDTTTEAGFAWDAIRGKKLRDDVDALNSALNLSDFIKIVSKNVVITPTQDAWKSTLVDGWVTPDGYNNPIMSFVSNASMAGVAATISNQGPDKLYLYTYSGTAGCTIIVSRMYIKQV